jgi:uncharacterized protein involved in outer membrane biogenesis
MTGWAQCRACDEAFLMADVRRWLDREPPLGMSRGMARALAVTVGVVVLLIAVVLFFPWDVLRGPLNRYVSDQTGRHFEITRRLDVKPGWTTRVRLDGVTFANPEWARDPYLLQAESAEFEIRLLPLLLGRLELPSLALQAPQLGLQIEEDGRRTWALGRDTSDPSNVPLIGTLAVDKGELHFIDRAHSADIRMAFEIDPQAGNALPLKYDAKGRWQGEPFSANGRTGSVLVLNTPLREPFPLQINAVAGSTSLRATGTLASLATVDGANASFELRGANLADLYRLVGVVLPETPRYALNGHVTRQGPVWNVTRIRGRLGQSDLGGELAYDRSQAIPLLTGKLQSKVLDFDDLAPLVGLPEQPRSVAAGPAVPAVAGVAPASAAMAKKAAPPGRVLPTATLDVRRLRAMDADVVYSAARISNVRALPLERADIHIRIKAGVMDLDPLKLGVAGGQLSGRLRINATSDPAAVAVNLDARGLQLNRLFPAVESTRSSLGRMAGNIDLKGRGNSAASMLGTASGDVALLMGQGQISNLLLEFAGLDGGEIIKFLLRGDRNVQLRCAAAAFDVKQGVMTSRAIVLDTVDTVIVGTGTVSLVDESLDLVLRPSPKDASILSLRSPLKITGTFAAPRAGPDKAALAGRAAIALALGALNPLLALAATIETGPGVDANCPQVLAQANAALAPRTK